MAGSSQEPAISAAQPQHEAARAIRARARANTMTPLDLTGDQLATSALPAGQRTTALANR